MIAHEEPEVERGQSGQVQEAGQELRGAGVKAEGAQVGVVVGW